MKKIISTILVCVLTFGIVFTLSSCNMVMGTYEGGNIELKFGLGKVTITETNTGIITGKVTEKVYECKYKIEDGKDGKTITFTYEEGADQHYYLKDTLTFAEGEEEGVKYIQIGTFGKFTKK